MPKDRPNGLRMYLFHSFSDDTKRETNKQSIKWDLLLQKKKNRNQNNCMMRCLFCLLIITETGEAIICDMITFATFVHYRKI